MFNLRKKRLYHGRRVGRRKFILSLLLIVIFVGLLIYFPLMEMNSQGRILISDAAKIKESFKNNNIDEVKSNLATLKKDYQKFSNASSKIYWLQFVPIVSGYVSDLRNGVTAGREMLDASEIAIEAIEPYADLIGFKKGATFAEKSADDRIQTAVLTLDKVLTRVDDISTHVEKAKVAIDKINPSRYPNKIGKREIRPKLISYIDQFDSIASLFINAKFKHYYQKIFMN